MAFSFISTCLNISAIHFKQTNNVYEGGGEVNLWFMIYIKLPLDNEGGY